MKKTIPSKPKKKKTLKLVSMKKLKKDTWDLMSKYVRLSYADRFGMCVCYTCGVRRHWKEMQAGHGISGRGNAILFELQIIRVQCMPCNIYKHGNYQVFIPKLIKEIGNEYERLEKKSHSVVKLDRKWYEGMKDDLNRELAQLM